MGIQKSRQEGCRKFKFGGDFPHQVAS